MLESHPASTVTLTTLASPGAMSSEKSLRDITAPVAGSNISTTVVIAVESSELFITDALIKALSPVRRKRGRLGCTITGLLDMISRDMVEVSMSSVKASAQSFHVVLALGAVNENVILPLSSVVSMGRKNASGISASRYSLLSRDASLSGASFSASAASSTASSSTMAKSAAPAPVSAVAAILLVPRIILGAADFSSPISSSVFRLKYTLLRVNA